MTWNRAVQIAAAGLLLSFVGLPVSAAYAWHHGVPHDEPHHAPPPVQRYYDPPPIEGRHRAPPPVQPYYNAAPIEGHHRQRLHSECRQVEVPDHHGGYRLRTVCD